MDTTDYDRLRQAYENAVDQWVAAIREEEARATPDRSMSRWSVGMQPTRDRQRLAATLKSKRSINMR